MQQNNPRIRKESHKLQISEDKKQYLKEELKMSLENGSGKQAQRGRSLRALGRRK